MSNAVFLRPDENGNWGSVNVIGGGGGGGTVDTYGNVDTNSATASLQGVGAYNLLYNGTNWVRQRTVNQYLDGNTGSTLPATALLAFNGTTFDRLRTTTTTGGVLRVMPSSSSGTTPDLTQPNSDTFSASGSYGMGVLGFNFAYAPSSAGNFFERVRAGKIYKWIEFLNLADATATTVWTPASGRKFRLMGIQISTSAAATVHLRDGAGGTRFYSQRTGGADTKDFSFGNGYLSATANNVLEILNSSGATINVWVNAWGTEE